METLNNAFFEPEINTDQRNQIIDLLVSFLYLWEDNKLIEYVKRHGLVDKKLKGYTIDDLTAKAMDKRYNQLTSLRDIELQMLLKRELEYKLSNY